MNYEPDWAKVIESMLQTCDVGWTNGLTTISLPRSGALINAFLSKTYGLNNSKIDVNRKLFIMSHTGYESVRCFHSRKK